MTYLRTREDGTLIDLPGGSVHLGELSWAVRTPLSAEGHEAITRNAIGPARTITFTVAGRPMTRVLSPVEQAEIIAGNRSVDLGWMGTGVLFSFNKAEQKRHALRRELSQPQAAALADIVASLSAQHAGILAERDPMRRLHKVGQALHLVQDSFSPAHTLRRPGAGWCISYIRNFGRGSAPTEHGVPRDGRDEIARSRAEAAQAVSASRRYLEIVFKAIYGRTRPDPVAAAEAAREVSLFIASSLRGCVP